MILHWTDDAKAELRKVDRQDRPKVQDIAQRIAQAHGKAKVGIGHVRQARQAAGPEFAPEPGEYVEETDV